MYSPKISEDLIPTIYRIAKENKTRMTTLVNGILKKALDEMEGIKDKSNENRSVAAGYADIIARTLEKGRKAVSGKRIQKVFDHCTGQVDKGYQICDSARKGPHSVGSNQSGKRRHHSKDSLPAPATPAD